MALKVKPASAAAEKFAARAAGASKDYEAGVRAPKQDWQSATAAASDNYDQGVQQAVSERRFAAGVNAAGNEKYMRGATGKGVQRYGAGVSAAKGDYAQGVAPYLDVISNTDLPARGPRGSAQNINRVSAIAENLHKTRLAKAAAGR